ncbi:energy transducer TonB [Tahibacter caeni]|uniref:energy transducer TonB n=1 Tax=Tahibacter caeni TaxID=1453545 RepID=UPI00214784A0|nr:energy transducer TonB [Tahibacter caeni]
MSTLVLSRGFQWKRSSAISATLALHALAALAVLAPPAYIAAQKAADPPVQAITVKREEPPPPPPPVLEVKHKPKAPVVRTVAPPRPEPVRADPVVTEQTEMSYPATPEPELPAEPAGPVETAPSALGYKSMKTVPYPPIAKRQRMEGTVVLRVFVGIDGVPQRIEIERSSGHSVLDRAAKEAVLGWRFEPGTRNGQPFAAYGLVPIAFKLTEL